MASGGCSERRPVFKGGQKKKKDTRRALRWSGRWDKAEGRDQGDGPGEGRNEEAGETGREEQGEEAESGSLWCRPQSGHRTP